MAEKIKVNFRAESGGQHAPVYPLVMKLALHSCNSGSNKPFEQPGRLVLDSTFLSVEEGAYDVNFAEIFLYGGVGDFHISKEEFPFKRKASWWAFPAIDSLDIAGANFLSTKLDSIQISHHDEIPNADSFLFHIRKVMVQIDSLNRTSNGYRKELKDINMRGAILVHCFNRPDETIWIDSEGFCYFSGQKFSSLKILEKLKSTAPRHLVKGMMSGF